MRKTKVIVTLGPATYSSSMVEEMISLGVDAFRLSFSYRDHQSHLNDIQTIREASKRLQKEVAIIQDISGYKVRVKGIKGRLGVKSNDIIRVSKIKNNDRYTINFSNPDVIDRVDVAQTIYFNNGVISALIISKQSHYIELKILNNGELYSNQGVNLPYCDLRMSGFSQKDLEDLNFGANYEVDIVALSYIKTKQEIEEIREFLEGIGSYAKIYAKIELKEAVKNIDEILSVSDGVIIERGDLAIDVGLQKVPHIQKEIIKKASELSIPSIISNQILSSMVTSQTPTRAEVSDIANAVYDKTDAVMLSEETAVGKFPIESIGILNEVILESELYYPYSQEGSCKVDIFTKAATKIASELDVKGIVTFTTTGNSVQNISKYRPNKTIYAIAHSLIIQRQLSVVWGVNPIFITKRVADSKSMIQLFIKKAKVIGLIDDESSFVLTMGSIVENDYSINLVKLLDPRVIKKLEKSG